jgi:hypothetical protein
MNVQGPQLGITRSFFEGDQVRNYWYNVLSPRLYREDKERKAAAALALASGGNAAASSADYTITLAQEEFDHRDTLPLPVSNINRRREDGLNHGSSGPSKRFEDYQDRKRKRPVRDN